MAILGTFVEKSTQSRAGDALSGVTVGTLAHSLPATNAEFFIPILRSTQEQLHNPGISVLGLGSNASLLTVGYRVSSTGSAPTIMYDVFAGVFHSIIR